MLADVKADVVSLENVNLSVKLLAAAMYPPQRYAEVTPLMLASRSLAELRFAVVAAAKVSLEYVTLSAVERTPPRPGLYPPMTYPFAFPPFAPVPAYLFEDKFALVAAPVTSDEYVNLSVTLVTVNEKSVMPPEKYPFVTPLKPDK